MESWVVFFYIPDKRMPAFFLVFLHRLFFSTYLPTTYLPYIPLSRERGEGNHWDGCLLCSRRFLPLLLFFSCSAGTGTTRVYEIRTCFAGRKR